MNDLLLTKTPAQDREAEEALISAVLIDNSVFQEIEFLSPDDFYVHAHHEIFKSISNLIKQRQPADLVTVSTALKSSGNLEQIGGAAYLAQIADCAPVALNAHGYAQAIKDCAVRRKVTLAASKILSMSLEPGNLDDLISFAQSSMLDIQGGAREDVFQKAGDIAENCFNEIFKEKESSDRLITGFHHLDKLLDIAGPKLIIIAARPSMGKTALAMSIMKEFGMQGVKSGFLSLEMSRSAIGKRWLAMMSRVNTMKISNHELNESDKDKMFDAVRSMYDWGIYVDDDPCKIRDIERKGRKMKKLGCKSLFIDQLSHIGYDSRLDEYHGTTACVKAISNLKKELGIPIFLLCQISRKVEDRKDKKPVMADLKQTGRIEEDADIVITMYRPWVYDKAKKPEQVSVNIAKNRDGATFEISTIDDKMPDGIRFNSKTTMFS